MFGDSSCHAILKNERGERLTRTLSMCVELADWQASI